jgi:glycerol-3-phosphate acyltransferase PlsX
VITLSVDVMSGDAGPQQCVPGALLALARDPQLHLLLVGQPDVVAPLIDLALPEHGAQAGQMRERLQVVEASEVVGMDESAREAIRRRKHSSMRVAIDLVHSGSASGTVSSGNTGALTAIAHFVLKCLPEVERAPIMSAVPGREGFTHLLDLGANTRATPQQLLQFALMGAIVARDVHGIGSPRLGLLNIGTEEIKGHEVVQEAHALIRARVEAGGAPFRYAGFAEGNDIFESGFDVIVTDGFTGNVALKTMEGLADLVARRLRAEFEAGPGSRIAGLIARPVLRRVAVSLDPRRYNGAVMVGLKGVVVKSHGRADALAFSQAVALAAQAVRRGLIGHVAQSLTEVRT